MRERLSRLRYEQVAWGIAVLTGVALSASRLVGVHGPESALALGVVLPPLAGALGARAFLNTRRSKERRLETALGQATLGALVLWALPVLILALNQLRVRNCAPVEGLAFMVLGPGLGTLLAALAGVAAGMWVGRPKLATTLAALAPLASYGVGFWSFWSTPAIFVYDHFAGWFPGTLYDEDIGLPMSLVTFRLVTVAWGLALLNAVHAFRLHDTGTRRRLPRPLPLTMAILWAGAAAVAHRAGPQLGHRTTVAAIDEALGLKAHGDRCVVHAPRELSPREVQRLVDDCDFRVARAEEALEVRQREPLHAYFYRSAQEKQRWMGAGRTFIAKPWRAEVHLQLRDWPHSVLAHEVVHVVAGNAARGPFHVAASAGGLWPNPGLVEGIAVAIEWPERDGMNPHQYASAMKTLGELPGVADFMSLGFLRLPAPKAYTSAGSFVRWLLDTRGAAVVREVHRSGSLGSLGATADLERQWHTFLDTVRMPPGAQELARVRFARTSIFETTCPHTLARLRGELGADLAAGDDRRVLQTCRALLAIEPAELSALVTLPGTLARQGRLAEAEGALAQVEGLPKPLVARAQERVADAYWLRHQRERARRMYEALLRAPQGDDEARAREVKVLAIDAGGPAERLIRELLVGPHGNGVSSPVAVHLAREIERFRPDGLGAYLEARQLIAQDRYDLALPRIETAIRLGLPTNRIEDEALRMEAVSLFATEDLRRSEERWRRALERPRLRNAAREWLDRIRFQRQRLQRNGTQGNERPDED